MQRQKMFKRVGKIAIFALLSAPIFFGEGAFATAYRNRLRTSIGYAAVAAFPIPGFRPIGAREKGTNLYAARGLRDWNITYAQDDTWFRLPAERYVEGGYTFHNRGVGGRGYLGAGEGFVFPIPWTRDHLFFRLDLGLMIQNDTDAIFTTLFRLVGMMALEARFGRFNGGIFSRSQANSGVGPLDNGTQLTVTGLFFGVSY